MSFAGWRALEGMWVLVLEQGSAGTARIGGGPYKPKRRRVGHPSD